jgi:glycosyltransferase involved in cell wall biosynthesis
VDDGSTDNSREIIRTFRDPRIIPVFKENAGQLSAFNAGAEIARGEIVCFLDSDDLYPSDYLQAVAEMFARHPDCGCLLANNELFGKHSEIKGVYSGGFLGCHPISVVTRHEWIGANTSACSFRRKILQKILPYTKDLPYWKTRADDLLIFGADLAGAIKYSLAYPRILYRVHGNNLFFGSRELSEEQLERRRTAINGFCDEMIRKNYLSYAGFLYTECRLGKTSFYKLARGCANLYKTRKKIRFPYFLFCGLILFCCLFLPRKRQKKQ